MALLGGTLLTISDWAKRIDANGKIARIAELLSQRTPILEDLPFIEANDILGHRTTVRTGLPLAAWKNLNSGVPFTRSRTAQVTETIGIQEQRSAVDEDHPGVGLGLADLRLSEAPPDIETNSPAIRSPLFYS